MMDKREVRILARTLKSTFDKEICLYEAHSRGYLPGLETNTIIASAMNLGRISSFPNSEKRDVSLGASSSICWE